MYGGGAFGCRACDKEITAAPKHGADDNSIVDQQFSKFSGARFLDVKDDVAVTFGVG